LADGIPPVSAATYVIGEVSTNQLLNVAVNSAANLSKSVEIRSSAMYVTGSHNFTAGASFFRGSYHRPVSVYGNVVLRLNAGAAARRLCRCPPIVTTALSATGDSSRRTVGRSSG
jgi:hypothetical protein